MRRIISGGARKKRCFGSVVAICNRECLETASRDPAVAPRASLVLMWTFPTPRTWSTRQPFRQPFQVVPRPTRELANLNPRRPRGDVSISSVRENTRVGGFPRPGFAGPSAGNDSTAGVRHDVRTE